MTVRPPTIEAGEAQEKKGDWAKAAELYEQCAAAAPDERALLKLAGVREKLGQPAEAAAAYRKVADLQLKAGFAAKAVAALRQAARLSPDDVALVASLAEQLEAQGKLGDAVQVLEGAGRAAALRGDEPGRLALLERLAVLDGSMPLALALADALARAGRRAEALDRLRRAALRLGQEEAHADRLAVLERLLLLAPGDREAALQACKLSLVVRQPRRGLVAVRNAMDDHLDDAELVGAAARALDAMGERIRATLLHREAARRLERAGDASAAYDEWRTVLAFDPSDHESLEHMRALSEPATAAPPPARPAEPPPAPRPAQEPTLEIQLDEVSPARVEVDVPLLATATPVPILMPEPEFVLADEPLPERAASEALPTPAVVGPFGSMAISGPPKPSALPPAPRGDAGPASPTFEIVRPAVRAALVLGDGPEAAWIERALSDLDLTVERMGREAMTAALEKAGELQPELVFSPPALAQAWRESGPWKVASLVALSRAHARAAVAADGLDVVDAEKVESAEGLKAALARFGAPLELVGPFEGPVVVPGTTSPGYHLTVARERLGPELFAQAAQRTRTMVVVAGDGRDAVALAAWQEAQEPGLPVVQESPGPVDEGAALVLARRVARALRLEGLAVVVLARTFEHDAFESMRLGLGPGGLAVEERIGRSLPELAAQLARGEGLPQDVERRGTALSVLFKGALSSVANLRVEPSADGSEAFVCSRAADRAQALRRLRRALER